MAAFLIVLGSYKKPFFSLAEVVVECTFFYFFSLKMIPVIVRTGMRINGKRSEFMKREWIRRAVRAAARPRYSSPPFV